MKVRWFTVLWRFWPGVLAFAIVFSLLTWLMQPRPRAIQTVKLPYDRSLFLTNGVHYSPDQRSIAISFEGDMDHDSHIVVVYDLHSAQQLFKNPATLGQFAFHDKGPLFYLGGEHAKFPNENRHEKLMCWNPVTQEQKMISELDVTWPHLKFKVYDLIHDTSDIECLSALSADGNWWIVPRMNENSLWYERINTQTGISAGKLNLPEMKRESKSEHVLSMCFTKEKDVLLVETDSKQEVNTKSELHWIDLKTGQSLHSVFLPKRVARFCVAQKDLTVIDMDTDAEEKPMLMAFHGPNRDLQLIVLDEIEKLQAQPPQNGKKNMSVPAVAEQTPMVDVKSLTVVTGWRYRSTPTEGSVGQHPFEEWSPEYFYSVRNLKTGELLCTHCLRLLSGTNHFDIKENTLDVRKVLPGPVLILSQYVIENDPESFLEKSLVKVRNWLNLPSSGYLHKLHFIDAKSGTVLNTLQNPYTGGLLQLSSDEKALTISHYWDGDEARLEYDYPLHKPWLRIWTWALAVAATITLLAELCRWRRRSV